MTVKFKFRINETAIAVNYHGFFQKFRKPHQKTKTGKMVDTIVHQLNPKCNVQFKISRRIVGLQTEKKKHNTKTSLCSESQTRKFLTSVDY